MNYKLLIFTLAATFYFPLMPMNKQQVAWHAKAIGYSIGAAGSAALVIYALIEIPNRPPLDTFTSIVAGCQGTHYFGKDAYKNIAQAWTGKSLKPTPEQAERIITEKVHEKVQDMASSSNSVELDVELIPPSGPTTMGTLRVRPKTHESSMDIAKYLDQGNARLKQEEVPK